ncbi:hypothetical protein QR680_000350 [Steinernema hermaphroditum]|uniref:Rad50/SbcC-type AAA domain-containing protein n=1 Tax=Steinernema hermaphroditum TaxID=289476 RepID=A0AA39LE05_9BILA|nr:hypothetical protein QR680_000350 [Steinernema hermaphroditum]
MSSPEPPKRRSELLSSEGPYERSRLAKRVRVEESAKEDITDEGYNLSEGQKDNTEVEDHHMEDREKMDQECKIAGRLVSVELENFMCHKHLLVNFDEDRNCTYIGGSNGSGKSALFAAINLGLGGRGRANERGGNAAAYIREGTNRAQITIVLTNEGIGSHPNYARQIVVRRTITSKSISYELKSRCAVSGREVTVSRKKRDLDEICRRFNIDLENPVVWMSQDRSREFLQNLQPKKLFQMFIEVSKVGTVQSNYEESKKQLHDCQIKLNECKELLNRHQEKYEQSKSRLATTHKIHQVTDEMQDVEWEMEWLPLKENRENIVSCDRYITELEMKISNLKAKKEAVSASIAVLNQTLAEAVISQELKARKKQQQEDHRLKDAQQQTLAEEERELASKISSLAKQQSTAERKLALLMNQVEQLAGINYKEHKANEQRLKDEMERLVAEETCSRSLQLETNESRAKVQRDREVAEQEVRRLQMLLRSTKERQDTVEAEQRRTQDILNDRSARFGKDVPRIKKILSENTALFQRQPIGPVGSFISVTDEKWLNVVEFVLRRQLCTFLVASGEDRKMFYDLLDRNGISMKPTVICQRFHDVRLDISRFEPDHNLLTVLRAITVTDDNVFNNLIEDCGVAGVLLLDSDEEARRLMSNSPPRNVSKAMTLNFGEALPVSAAKPYRFYSNVAYKARLLADSDAERQKDFVAELGDLRMTLETVSQELVQSTRISTELKRKLTNTEHEEGRLQSFINSCAEKRDEIIAQLRDMSTVVDVDTITNLELEIGAHERAISDIKRNCVEAKDSLIAKQQSTRAAQDEVSKLERNLRDLHLQEEAVRNRRVETEALITEKRHKVNSYDLRITEYEARRSAKECEAQSYRERSRAKEGELMRLCVERNRPQFDLEKVSSRDELEEANRRLHEDLRKYEEAAAGIPVTPELLKEQKAALHNLKSAVDSNEVVVRRLKEITESRRREMQHTVAELTVRLQAAFERYVNLRGFKGSMKIDFSTATLDIKVFTHRLSTDTWSSEEKNLRSLSGGERSYATACFILALWEVIECPFRLLDEFDVFMDMSNRRMVMEAFAYAATEKFAPFQFLFFTPQGIQDLKENKKIKILKMPEVRR